MADSFGGRLRRQRERQKIELSAIAEQTKISLALLEGLERDDIERWPAGIFRRSFVRSYAQAIGLDPDAVVHEFLELFPDPSAAVDPIASLTSASEHSEKPGPPTRLRYLVDRAIDAMPGHTAQRGVLAHGTGIEISKAPASRPSPSPGQPDLLQAAQLCTELAVARIRQTCRRFSSVPRKSWDAAGRWCGSDPQLRSCGQLWPGGY